MSIYYMSQSAPISPTGLIHWVRTLHVSHVQYMCCTTRLIIIN